MPGTKIRADGAGRALVAGDVAVGAGWGDGAVTTTIKAGSNTSRGRITVLSAGANQAQATATVTVTFPVAFSEKDNPVVVVSRDTKDEAASGAITIKPVVKDCTKTGFVVVLDTVPVTAKDYGFSYVVVA